MFDTRTFTFKERESRSWLSSIEIRYCSYCGKKAILKSEYDRDSGEELTYYCDCEDAQHEQNLRNELAKVNKMKFDIEQKIIKLEDLNDTETVSQMKYQNELTKIKKKYSIA